MLTANISSHAGGKSKSRSGLQLAPSTCEVVVLVSRPLVGELTTYPVNLAKLCARIPLRGPKTSYNLASQLVQLDHNGECRLQGILAPLCISGGGDSERESGGVAALLQLRRRIFYC